MPLCIVLRRIKASNSIGKVKLFEYMPRMLIFKFVFISVIRELSKKIFRSKMIKIGLTGGIGCGKSLVAKLLERQSIKIISADRIAKTIVNSDPQVKAQIIEAFGESVYNAKGELDRKKVAAMVFSDDNARKKLNAIVHPHVLAQQQRGMQRLEKTEQVVGVEAALIYEAQAEPQFDYIVVVSATPEVVIDRLKKRDGLTEHNIINRINSQLPLAEKENRADYVIFNNGSLEELEANVTQFMNWVKSRTNII